MTNCTGALAAGPPSLLDFGRAGSGDIPRPQKRASPAARCPRVRPVTDGASSNSTMPAATETLRLATVPRMGSRRARRRCSRVSRRSPLPSPPSTSAIGGASFARRTAARRASASAPTTQTPASLQPAQRARQIRRAIRRGTVSAAPVAAFSAAGVSFAECARGTTHGVDAGRVGRAQAGAEVARILDLVEDEQPQCTPASEHERFELPHRCNLARPAGPRSRLPDAHRRPRTPVELGAAHARASSTPRRLKLALRSRRAAPPRREQQRPLDRMRAAA